MKDLRQLALKAGRALALLAALVVAIVPALPAHAHMHASDGLVSHHAIDPAQDDDSNGSGKPPLHAADCCLASHVPVIPTASAVPLQSPILHASLRADDRDPPPDASAEALPEPPRPAA